ncbi:MDR family MFS transporter [Heyndrickxia ginsengihumi]|uniref:MDR family MFS transporter n=1 Tax=Heyndrickxia ginsengihumi TaxID=363870 RepID=UPI003D23307D
MRIRDWDQNLKVRLFGESLMNFTFWMSFPFLTIYFTKAFGNGITGILLIASQVFSVVANLLGGFYADRYGRKRMMTISALSQGISFIIFAFANSPWFHSSILSFICFTTISIFSSIYSPASQAMVADVVDEKHRSHVFSVFYASLNITVVVSPILGGIFFTYYRFELLTFCGLSCIILAALLTRFTRETTPKTTHTIQSLNTWYNTLLNQVKHYQVILYDKVFLLFIFAGVLVAQTFMQLDFVLPVYTNKVFQEGALLNAGMIHLHFSSAQFFGFILSENGLVVAVLTITITKWISQFPHKNIFILSSLLYAISIFLFGIWNSSWGFIASMLLFSFAELIVTGIQQSFVSILAPDHMRAQYFAAASLRNTIGKMLAPISIPLVGWIGFSGTFAILSCLAIISAIIYIIMFKLYDQKHKRIITNGNN